MSNKNLTDQAEESVELPEGEIGASVPIRSFDLQTKIRRSKVGYVVEKETKDDQGEKQTTWIQISDFVMLPVRVERFVDKDKRIVQRYVKLLNPVTGYGVEVLIKPQELTGLYNFRTWLWSQGNFSFTGADTEFNRILAMTFRGDGDEVLLKNICGYEKDTGNWIFNNGGVAKDGSIALLDAKKGYIMLGGSKYRLASNERDENIKRAPTPKFGVDPTKSKALLKKIISNTIQLWGPGAEIGWAWALSCLWRSRWIDETEQFPLLFVIGNPSIGKTQFIKSMILKFFGLTFDPLSISKMTEVGFYNLANSMCNIPLYLDEFKDDIVQNEKVLDCLKGNADNTAMVRGSLDQFEVKSRTQRTGLLISGETKTMDNALSSRGVAADLIKNDNRELFVRTVDMCEDLSCALLPMVQQWDDLWLLIKDRRTALADEWTRACTLDSRPIQNYAKVCATMDVIFPDESRKGRFFDALMVKGKDNAGTNILAKMISSLPWLVQGKRLFIPCKRNDKKKRFAVNATFLINAYSEYARTTPQSARELIRSGHMGKLLVPSHAEEPMAVNIDELKDGRVVTVTSRCFVFDMNNSVVREAVEKLSATDKPDGSEEGPPPDPNNPDDPYFMK